MGLLVLMYHRTPPKAGHLMDVAMPLFQEQIYALQSIGARFVQFNEAFDKRCYQGENVVAITFDDGHGSNLDAMAFLHDAGIPCTSFFVSDYVRRGQDGFMDVAAFKDAASYCEVGGHSATHANLCALLPDQLREELLASKGYLEEFGGRRVTTMSAPGGQINRRVVNESLLAGYKIIGDSKPVLNTRPRPQLHRICIQDGQTPEYLVSILQAGPLYWLNKRIRHHRATQSLRSAFSAAIGHTRYDCLKRVLLNRHNSKTHSD